VYIPDTNGVEVSSLVLGLQTQYVRYGINRIWKTTANCRITWADDTSCETQF